jgi:type II secretory pathway component PulK
MKKHKKRAKTKVSRGFILLVVLMVLAAITLSALAFTQTMLIGHEESRLAGESLQARNASESGIDAARLFLAKSRKDREDAGGTYSNPSQFQAIPVMQGIGALNVCNYTMIASNMNEDGEYSGVRYGLQNESARLNVNVLPVIDQMNVGQAMRQLGGAAGAAALGAGAGSSTSSASTSSSSPSSSSSSGDSSSGGVGRSLLMALPGMTEDIADCILDFIDEDNDPRQYGAELDYYHSLQPPYSPINGPLHSIEQLLLVKGVTPRLLFGLDQNRNGVLEASESAASLNSNSSSSGSSPSSSSSSSSSSGSSSGSSSSSTSSSSSSPPNLGWASYLTLFSKEKNVANDGAARVNINGDFANLQSDVTAAAGEDLATFIIAYRMLGGTPGNAVSALNAAGGLSGAGAGGIGGAGGFGAGGGGFGGARGGQGGPNGRPGGPGGPGNGPPGGRGPNGGGPSPGGVPGGGTFGGPGGGPGGFGPGPAGFGPNRGGGNGGGQNGGPNNDGQRPGQGGGRPGRSNFVSTFPSPLISSPFTLIAFLEPQAGRGPQQGGLPGGGGGTGGPTGLTSGGSGGGQPKTQEWKASNFASLKLDTSQGGGSKVGQVLDLIGGQFSATVNNEQVVFTSPLSPSPIAMAAYLPTIMDKLTAVNATILPGRININEAPREVLAGLPGITEEILDKLIESRSGAADNSNRKFETWPMVEGIITQQQMQTIAPLVTGGGDVMRVQSVGYFEQSAGFSRIEAVIDASGSVPMVVLYRKMDHLGRGFSQTTLGQRAQGLTVSK